jgi:hypothetical protein
MPIWIVSELSAWEVALVMYLLVCLPLDPRSAASNLAEVMDF